EAHTRAAIDRCGDAGVAELCRGILDRGAIRLGLGFELSDQRALGIDGLLAREPLRLEDDVAGEVLTSIGELRLVLGERGARLIESGLKRTGIDLGEELAARDLLALGESDFGELAVHSRCHLHGVVRLYGAESVEI